MAQVANNFIQLIIRGLTGGQQWQISPTWTVTDIEDTTNDVAFTYETDKVAEWFDRVWNGSDAVGTQRGFGDLFTELFTSSTTISEVRVLARTGVMPLPEQQIYAANITGTRSMSAAARGQSFIAASCFAQSDIYGYRGASLRMPGAAEEDYEENWFNAGALLRYREGILEAFDFNPSAAGMEVMTPDGIRSVITMKNAVVRRVFPTPSGEPPAAGPKAFPYESPYPIFAIPCTDWQVHPWVSTQNSRKIGRGS